MFRFGGAKYAGEQKQRHGMVSLLYQLKPAVPQPHIFKASSSPGGAD